MIANDTYCTGSPEAAAVALVRGGLWDLALEMLDPAMTALRAQIQADRFFWRLDGAAAAEQAVAALGERESVLGEFYGAQLAYTRTLFSLSPRPDDGERVRAGFRAAIADPRVGAWATFWMGVVTDHLEHDPIQAALYFADAHKAALDSGDRLLESYTSLHLGGYAQDKGDAAGLDLLWRSYHLRAALGARPQTAAAAAALAASLPEAQAQEMRAIAARTALELRLTWLDRSFSGAGPQE